MNLLLCEHVDFHLLRRLRNGARADVVVHAAALARYSAVGGSLALSPLHLLSDDHLREYREQKVGLAGRIRAELPNRLTALGEERSSVASVFNSTVERLFFHGLQGCLDAWTFSKSFASSRLQEDELRVIAGGRYRLTELTTLIWWLAVCDRLRLNGYPVRYYWARRGAAAISVANPERLLELLVSESSPEPRLLGHLPGEFRKGLAPACLAWVGALRFSNGWEPEIQRRTSRPSELVRICELGRSDHYPQPCLELSVGTGLATAEVGPWLQLARTFVDRARTNGDAGATGDVLLDYFTGAVAPVVFDRVARTAATIDSMFGEADVTGVFSVTAPFLESIALHEWSRRRHIAPILLPHSFTSSHEFPAGSYATALTFFGSSDVMPDVQTDPIALEKEEIVSMEEVRARHLAQTVPKRLARRQILFPLRQLLALSAAQALPVVRSKMRDRLLTWLLLREFAEAQRAVGTKIGLLLNYEHQEFFLGLDFNRLHRYISDLAEELEGRSSGPSSLFVRRKPGGTNLQLLHDYLRRQEASKWVAISPDKVSLGEFAEACDVVTFFQGTSAVPEIITYGVPVVQLAEPDILMTLDEPYIVLPERVVPRMTLADIVSRLETESDWAPNLAANQMRWAKAKMASR